MRRQSSFEASLRRYGGTATEGRYFALLRCSSNVIRAWTPSLDAAHVGLPSRPVLPQTPGGLGFLAANTPIFRRHSFRAQTFLRQMERASVAHAFLAASSARRAAQGVRPHATLATFPALTPPCIDIAREAIDISFLRKLPLFLQRRLTVAFLHHALERTRIRAIELILRSQVDIDIGHFESQIWLPAGQSMRELL